MGRMALIAVVLMPVLLSARVLQAPTSENYLWEKPVTVSVSAEASDLKAELEREVQKILDAGHLEPAYYAIGLAPHYLYWGYPGEQAYILSLALKHLSPDLRERVQAFLYQEVRDFPPESIGFLHNNNSGWGSAVLGGNRREYYPMPTGVTVNIWPPVQVPVEALYILWAYADSTGDWEYIAQKWSSLVSLYNTRSGSVTRFGEIAGLIGMARLAEEMSKSPWSKPDAASVRSSAAEKATAALATVDYAQYVARAMTDLISSEFDWSYPVFCFLKQEGAVGCFFSQEIGRFLREQHLTAVHASVDRYIKTADTYPDSLFPGWFVYRSDYDYAEWRLGNASEYTGENLGSESSFRPPDFGWTWFMIRAYVFDDPAPTLRKFVDIPTAVGDLYHIQRLIAAIDAYGISCWQDVRTGNQTCEGNATPPTFVDVPFDHPYHDSIETLYQAGYTAGCNLDPLMYCPEQTMNRAESAVFVERGIHATTYSPADPVDQVFADMPLDSWAAKWVNGLWADQYTAGCGTDPLIYCPWQGHTRAEGCVFYLRMLNGAGFEPPQPTQRTFADVPLDTWYARWVQAAYEAALIEPCQTAPELRFCPDVGLTRAVSAYMMVQAKDLQVP